MWPLQKRRVTWATTVHQRASVIMSMVVKEVPEHCVHVLIAVPDNLSPAVWLSVGHTRGELLYFRYYRMFHEHIYTDVTIIEYAIALPCAT